jgi:hypothetical protein
VVRPYNVQLGAFLTNMNAVQQAYVTTELDVARRAGCDPNVFLLTDEPHGQIECTVAR